MYKLIISVSMYLLLLLLFISSIDKHKSIYFSRIFSVGLHKLLRSFKSVLKRKKTVKRMIFFFKIFSYLIKI